MGDDYAAQVSIKHGSRLECMTNVRADDVETLVGLLNELVRFGPDIADACEALGAVQAIAAAMPGTKVIEQNSPSQTGSRAQETCPHGTMRFKETADYAGHFCPADRNDPNVKRCAPRYTRQASKGAR